MKMQYEKEKKKFFLKEKKHNQTGKHTKQQEKEQRENRPISWKHSEALQHMYGENSLKTKESTTGLYDRQGEQSAHTKMKEVFRAENSYGNIAVGANKKKEAMVVVSQKREHNGTTTEEYQKNVHMERKKKIVSSAGEYLVNNNQMEESAWAYKGNTKRSEKKAWKEMKDFRTKEESRMLEKRMPFLLLKKDRKQIVSLREQIREKYEKGEKKEGQLLEKHKETLQQEIHQKEQNERMIQKKIQFAWEKARKIGADDFEMRRSSRVKEEKTEEDLAEIPNMGENNGEKSKK